MDTDFFLNSVAILQHTSLVFGAREANFPVENRPTTVRVRTRAGERARERAGERARERAGERARERAGERERERESGRESEREREIERAKERKSEGDRERRSTMLKVASQPLPSEGGTP